MSNLPLIVGYGGINAAGRSVFDFSHQRMLFESIDTDKQTEVLKSLGHLMGTSKKEAILNKTLLRTIDDDFFDQHNFRSPKLPTLAGGQLPSGFNPAKTYNSRQHPRSLAMTIFWFIRCSYEPWFAMGRNSIKGAKTKNFMRLWLRRCTSR